MQGQEKDFPLLHPGFSAKDYDEPSEKVPGPAQLTSQKTHTPQQFLEEEVGELCDWFCEDSSPAELGLLS